MKLADLIMANAYERGVRHFFGLPGGGAPLDLMEAGRKIGVDFIAVAHESSAAIMAAYNGLMNETAGVALAIKGVGAANLAAGAATAYFERAPAICYCESAPDDAMGRELVSLCEHEKLFGPVAKYYARLNPEQAGNVIQEAAFRANDGRPGPVLVDIPSDMGQIECTLSTEPSLVSNPHPIDKTQVEALSQMIASSQRPVVLAGGDVIRAGAIDQFKSFVERIGAAVIINMDAHGVLPASHPRWAGIYNGSFGPNTMETEILGKADLALIIGSDTIASDMNWQSDVPTCELIARPEYQSLAITPRVRMNGSLKTSLAQLLPHSTQQGFSESTIQSLREKILGNFRRPARAKLAFQDIIAIMRDAVPCETVLISETAAFIITLNYLWPVEQPGMHYGTAGGRTMGLMLPAILGAKLASPDTPMAGIGADGSTLMRLGELEVFARTGIAVPLVIINDGALGTMKSRQKSRGLTDYALDFHPVDIASAARACGIDGIIVETPEQFEMAFRRALQADRTTLIDARVDPQPYQDSFAATVGIPS